MATGRESTDHAVPREGSRLGKYVLLEPAGQGGMSSVWQAWDEELKRRVALKILAEGSVPSGAGPELKRFLLEARTLAKLEHPNIVPIYDVGREGGVHYIAMKWIEGKTCAELAPDLTPRRAAEIARAAARGLEHIHSYAIVHRDVKPGNIMVDNSGHVYVMDFGLAQDVSARRQTKPRLTQAGLTVGTPAYMSPEQALGKLEELDATSDIFSLGATLFSLSTGGQMPFADPTSGEAMHHIIHDDPTDPRRIRPDFPPDLATIILHCLEKEKEKRYPTMGALEEDLDRYLKDEPVAATPPSLTTVIVRKAKRHRPTIYVSVAAGVLLAAAGAALWRMHRSNVLRERVAAEEERRKEDEERSRLVRRDEALARAERFLRSALEAPFTAEESCRAGIEECLRVRSADPAEPRNHWIEGRLHEIQGRGAEALEAYHQALTRKPDLREAARDRGHLYLERYLEEVGELTPFLQQHMELNLGPKPDLALDAPAALRRATQDFDRLRDLATSPAERAYAIAMAAAAERRPAEFEERYLSFRDDPFVRDARRWRGFVLYAAGRYEEAAMELDRHLQAKPGDAHALLLQSFCDLARNAHRPSQSKVEQAVAIDPRCTHARYTLGLLHHLSGRLREAEAEYTNVIAIDDGFFYAYLNRGLIRMRNRQLDLAMEDCRKSIDLRPRNSLGYNRRASVHHLRGDNRSTIDDYSRAIDLDPRYYYGYMNRARIYMEEKEYGAAIKDYTTAIDINSTKAQSYAERGYCYFAVKEWAKAVRDFEKAGALDSKYKEQVRRHLKEARKQLETD